MALAKKPARATTEIVVACPNCFCRMIGILPSGLYTCPVCGEIGKEDDFRAVAQAVLAHERRRA